jgi:hypothetical protein
MADPINLNKFRKARAKADKAKQAEENRAKHGQTKVEKAKSKAEADNIVKLIDGHRLTPDTDR